MPSPPKKADIEALRRQGPTVPTPEWSASNEFHGATAPEARALQRWQQPRHRRDQWTTQDHGRAVPAHCPPREGEPGRVGLQPGRAFCDGASRCYRDNPGVLELVTTTRPAGNYE